MCLRERSPLGLKELTKWVSLGSADASEIHDTNHYRTLKSLGYSCDGQEGLLVPSPGHTGLLEDKLYTFIWTLSSCRIYHQPKNFIDWSHLGQNPFFIFCYVLRANTVSGIWCFLKVYLSARGRFHRLGEEGAGRKLRKDKKFMYLAFNLCRML